MATTVGQHSVAAFTSPVNGTTPIDANSVRGNDNTVRSAYVDHDADPGIHVQSSTLASRPAAGTAGRKWITEDSGVYTLWFDDGTNWHPVSSENINLTVLATETLVKGDVVKVTGWNNGQDLPEVAKVSSTSDTAFAIITANVANGAMGYATNTGIIQDLATNGFSVGAILYPNGSGWFTATKPTSGTYQAAAYVLRSNANNGVLFVEFSAPRIVEASANTASTIVLRDASGNFSAGTITAGALTSTGLVTFASLKGTGATTVTNILDEDNMASDSATALATQQSIKAYVDAKVATVDTLAEVLANGNTTGAHDIIVTAGQKITTDTIAETTSAAGVTIDSVLLKDNAVTATTFNGTLNGAAPAGSLSGTTLASNVVSSSLTSVGTLANLTVTNPITGSVTGSSGSTTGNAATATALQTARNINGVSFNGTADITVTAAAGTLSGTTLASGVTASSLTSVGTLTSLTVSGNTSLASSSGGVGIGVAAGSSKLNVAGTFTKNTGDENTWGIRVTDDTAMATGVGGGLVFVGNYTSGGGKASFASIAGAKANSTTANGLGELRFYTTDASSFLQQRAVIDGAGNLGVGTSSPTDTGGFGRVVDVQGSTGAQVVCRDSDDTTKFARLSFDGGTTNVASVGAEGTATQVAFRAGGGEKMRLDASGNLGLGVTPSYQFDLLTPTSATDRQAVRINYGTTVGRAVYFGIDAAVTGTTYIQSATPSSVSSGTDLALNPKGGNVGVGTTSPIGSLDVATSATSQFARIRTTSNSASTNVGLRIQDGTTGTTDADGIYVGRASAINYLWTYENEPWLFGTNNTERARITSGGDFCVNATSGNGKLSVRGPGTTTGYSFEAANSAGTTRFIVQDGGLIQFLSNTSGTESGRFTTGGYFKASNNGTYNSGGAGTDHEFQQSAAGRALLVSNSNSNPTGILIYYGNVSPNGTGNRFWYCEDSTAVRAELRSNGGLANYTANDVNLSDERVKTDILPAPSYWDTLKAIEIVTFKYKDQTHDDVNVGVIAQQIEQVNPVWVDTDGFGETPEDGVPLKAVYSEDIKFAAIKALQEAMARIEALEARLEALEA